MSWVFINTFFVKRVLLSVIVWKQLSMTLQNEVENYIYNENILLFMRIRGSMRTFDIGHFHIVCIKGKEKVRKLLIFFTLLLGTLSFSLRYTADV